MQAQRHIQQQGSGASHPRGQTDLGSLGKDGHVARRAPSSLQFSHKAYLGLWHWHPEASGYVGES